MMSLVFGVVLCCVVLCGVVGCCMGYLCGVILGEMLGLDSVRVRVQRIGVD